MQVLSAIATGMSSAEAANDLGISLSTLRTHLKNIITKLEARSKLDAVLIAIREGRIRLD
jgi:DNA-binding CsgD family transcriptional regulator